MTFTEQVAVQTAYRREQAGQATTGLALLVQRGQQTAQPASVQVGPGGQLFSLAERQNLAEIAAVAVQGMPGDLALAAQVFEVGI